MTPSERNAAVREDMLVNALRDANMFRGEAASRRRFAKRIIAGDPATRELAELRIELAARQKTDALLAEDVVSTEDRFEKCVTERDALRQGLEAVIRERDEARTLIALMRVALMGSKGWIINGSSSAQARRDLKRLEEALAECDRATGAKNG